MIPFILHLRMDNIQHDTLYTNIRRNTRHPAKCSEKSYLCREAQEASLPRTGENVASNAKRYPLCENRRIPFTRNPPVSCLLGRCPNPLRTQKLCSGTMDKSIGCAICKSLVGGQLSAAPPLFPVVHSLPPAPCPAPEYGRYWPWPSAALSFPHGLFGSRRRPLSSPPAARRTRYSAP